MAQHFTLFEHEARKFHWTDQDLIALERLLHTTGIEILRARVQRGAYRSYQEIEDKLPVLKGKWHISEHLRHPEGRHLFAVTYDKFMVDVPLNRVFLFVIERLRRITRNTHTRQLLESLCQSMEEVTLLPTVTVTDTNAIAITRLNQRFAPLLELARLFLDKSALQLAKGDVSTFAFVFDMNRLFESFLTNFICRHRNEIFPVTLQAYDLLPQSRAVAFHLATHMKTSTPVFRLKPDLAIRYRGSNHFPLLLDMKYKRLIDVNITSGISQDDFYQMYVYAHRYACPCILLLYPQTVELPQPLCIRFDLTRHDNLAELEKVIIAATIDIRLDLNRRDEQQKLKGRLKEILTSECSL